jgi:hypothetical protein
MGDRFKPGESVIGMGQNMQLSYCGIKLPLLLLLSLSVTSYSYVVFTNYPKTDFNTRMGQYEIAQELFTCWHPWGT